MLAIQILAWLILAYLALCLSILLAGGIIMAIGAILSGILSIFATADDCDRFTVRPTWKSRNCWLALLVIFALVFSANHWDSFNAALSWFARTLGIILLSWCLWDAAKWLLRFTRRLARILRLASKTRRNHSGDLNASIKRLNYPR